MFTLSRVWMMLLMPPESKLLGTLFVLAVLILSSVGSLAAAYVFTTPPIAKYTCQFLDTAVSYVNQIPTQLLCKSLTLLSPTSISNMPRLPHRTRWVTSPSQHQCHIHRRSLVATQAKISQQIQHRREVDQDSWYCDCGRSESVGGGSYEETSRNEETTEGHAARFLRAGYRHEFGVCVDDPCVGDRITWLLWDTILAVLRGRSSFTRNLSIDFSIVL